MIIAVDTGGTKTLVAAFSPDGQLLNKVKFPTPKNTSIYIETVIQHIGQLASAKEIEAISIALPGVIRDQKAVICRNLGWRDFDVIAALKQRWPSVPMWLENDANLGGVGAARLSSPTPSRCLYVTVSTGVGGGFVVDGKIEKSLSESEFGDITLEYDGKITNWEHIAGGSAISGVYSPRIDESTESWVKEEVGRRIARGLLAVLPVLRPDIVAIGGGLGARYHLFSDYVEQTLSAELPEDYRCPVITAPNPEEIVAYGCYYHAKDQLGL